MKKLLIFTSLLALTGCGPKFKVGECAVIDFKDERESWESQRSPNTFKVMEIGKEKYRIEWFEPAYMRGQSNDNYIRSFDRVYSKVECPKLDVEMKNE